jgi:lipoprotein-anchoring transpeptidase ErfK/SrfK
LEVLEEDPLYLKKFVKDHPDNKMGWYLLGKQYETLGKKGKAKYCFAQAGDVYSAFEMTNPIELEPAEKAAETTDNSKMFSPNQLKQRIKVIYRSVVLAAFIIFTLTYLPTNTPNKAEESMSDMAASEAVLESGLNVFYIEDGSKANDIQKALKSMIAPDGEEKKLSIIVEAPKSADGKWVMWQKEPVPLLSAERDADTGTLVVSYHDSALCDCKAAEGTAVLKTVKSWKQQQEQLVVLRSTMAAYEKEHGALPVNAESLTRDYPENSIPGLSETMQKAYTYYSVNDNHKVIMKSNPTPESKPIPAPTAAQSQSNGNSSLPAEKPSTPTSEPKATNPTNTQHAAANYTIVPPLTEPLEIVVDLDTHQLALISGNVIVRKYPVGLGGKKTPLGSFIITEKVRSPNGHDNGDFGSRGMTLSDTLYAIHGTNKPSSIGLDESQGCIRMLKEDLEELFDMAPLGTKVTIGKVKLPLEPANEKTRFHSPQVHEEKNPGRIYKWLN